MLLYSYVLHYYLLKQKVCFDGEILRNCRPLRLRMQRFSQAETKFPYLSSSINCGINCFIYFFERETASFRFIHNTQISVLIRVYYFSLYKCYLHAAIRHIGYRLTGYRFLHSTVSILLLESRPSQPFRCCSINTNLLNYWV